MRASCLSRTARSVRCKRLARGSRSSCLCRRRPAAGTAQKKDGAQAHARPFRVTGMVMAPEVMLCHRSSRRAQDAATRRPTAARPCGLAFPCAPAGGRPIRLPCQECRAPEAGGLLQAASTVAAGRPSGGHGAHYRASGCSRGDGLSGGGGAGGTRATSGAATAGRPAASSPSAAGRPPSSRPARP